MLGLAGVTAIDVSAAAVTVSGRAGDAAERRADRRRRPMARAVARPVAVIVATEVFDEAQVTELVRLAVEPSE